VAQWNEEISHLKRQLGNVEIPPSFEENNSHISCLIPTSMRELVIPQYIWRLGTGEVEIVTGREPQESVYVIELYLTLNYS